MEINYVDDDGYDVNFVTKWMFLNWQVYNLVDFDLVRQTPYELKALQFVLQKACQYSHDYFVKELLDIVSDTNITFRNGDTLLHVICQSAVRPVEKARLIMMNDDTLVSKQNSSGLLALHLAVLNKSPLLCAELLKHRTFNINTYSRNQLTPLHVASHFGMDKNVEALLARNDIDVNVVDCKGDTPLHHAAGKRQFKTYTILLSDPRCDKTLCNALGKTPADDLLKHMKEYALTRSIQEFKAFVDCLPSCRVLDERGNTLLHTVCASDTDTLEKLQLLINCDATLLRIRNWSNYLPLHLAARNKDIHVLEYFLKSRVYISSDFAGYRERTPLHISCFHGYTEHVQLLLNVPDIDINARDHLGNTALHIASIKQFYNITRMLQDIPWCRTDIRNSLNRKAAELTSNYVKMIAKVRDGKPQDLKDILANSTIKFDDKYSNNLLHICAESKVYARDKAKILVKLVPSLLQKRNQEGFLPIHTAARNNNVEILEFLAGNGCLNELTLDQKSALHISSYHGWNESVCRLLMFDDIIVNQKDKDGNTAAHIAAQNDNIECLSNIANHSKYIPEIRNKNGELPYDINPTINNLKVFCAHGSASDLDALLKNNSRFLGKPVVNLLLPLVLTSHTEQSGKITLLMNYFPDIMHIASLNNDRDLLRVLLSTVTSSNVINKRDPKGYTPWDYASLNLDIESILLLESHPAFEMSVRGLTVLARVTFTEVKQISVCCNSTLRMIKGRLWHCHGDITIYNTELEKRQTIPRGDLGRIFSAVDVGEHVAVATHHGLFLITHSGQHVRTISQGRVRDVHRKSGLLYCSSGNQGQNNAFIQVYDTRTWQQIRVIDTHSQCLYKYGHTIHIGSEHITVGCPDTGSVHTITLTGERLHSTKRGEDVGEFVSPYLCHTPSDTVLAADWTNDRIQLRHEGVWSPVLLQPQPRQPLDAVYAGGALYVLSWFKGLITKYMPT